MSNRLCRWREHITTSRAYFAVFKLPVIILTAVCGMLWEFLVELPFMVVCGLEKPRWARPPRRRKPRGTPAPD